MIAAETGADMTRFPTPGHLCAWGGAVPASYESAGNRRPAGTRHGSPYLRRTLIEAARAAVWSKGNYHSTLYARITRRRGPNRAVVAVARSMLETAWHPLARPVPSTKTPVPTTSSATTILRLRRSGSSTGSRHSGSPSPWPKRPRSPHHPTTSPSQRIDWHLASRVHAPLRHRQVTREDAGDVNDHGSAGSVRQGLEDHAVQLGDRLSVTLACRLGWVVVSPPAIDCFLSFGRLLPCQQCSFLLDVPLVIERSSSSRTLLYRRSRPVAIVIGRTRCWRRRTFGTFGTSALLGVRRSWTDHCSVGGEAGRGSSSKAAASSAHSSAGRRSGLDVST